jgi:hypothetical protein
MPYEFGDIVLIAFPFTDQVGQKQRPTVVVSSPEYNNRRPDLVAMAITSQLRGEREFAEVAIEGWIFPIRTISRGSEQMQRHSLPADVLLLLNGE